MLLVSWADRYFSELVCGKLWEISTGFERWEGNRAPHSLIFLAHTAFFQHVTPGVPGLF